MLKALSEIFLDLRTVRSFAPVRNRIKAVVATLPRVSLAQALAQIAQK